MVVKPGPHAERLELLGGVIQGIADRLPAVQLLHLASACHDNVPASQRLVQLDRFWKILGREVTFAVVGRAAGDAEVVEQLSNIPGVWERPVEVWSVKLNAFVTHFRDSADSAHQVVFQLLPNRIKLEADGYALVPGRASQNSGGGRSQKGTTGETLTRAHRSR